ncbi:MAG: hypothetical protein P1U83_18675 [Roseovarius sp.]|nr:hypothetical protein [Roseovarius sp.]
MAASVPAPPPFDLVMLQKKLVQKFVIMSSVLSVGLLGLAVATTAPNTNRANWPETFDSNGERLYFTGIGTNGARITPSGGNHHKAMMGGGGCVDCHGIDRKGGRLWPSFWQVAPSITAEALEGKHTQDGHTHEIYDFITLAGAITNGRRPDGSWIGAGMPRWLMSEEDLNELVTFLLGH